MLSAFQTNCRPWLGLLVGLMLAACSGDEPAQDQAATTDDDGPAETTSVIRADATAEPGERLIAVPPLNWELRVQSLNPDLRVLEYGPPRPADADPDEPQRTTERLVFETFAADPMPEPADVLRNIALRLEERCRDVDAFNTFMGEENNYPTAVALLICHRHRGSDMTHVQMVKGIRGNDEFYVVLREKRVEPLTDTNDDDGARRDVEALSEVVGALALYMRSVSLCDDSLEAHPCTRGPLDL